MRDLNEIQIEPMLLPKHARIFIEHCKNIFETKKYKLFGYTKRMLPEFAYHEVQYAVTYIDNSNKILCRGLSSRKKKGLFALIFRVQRNNMMLQTLFNNGFRLITSDMPIRVSGLEARGIRWISMSLESSFEEMLIQHKKNMTDVAEKESCELIEIRSFSDYLDFPHKYRYLKN